jgi:hypothetical protein
MIRRQGSGEFTEEMLLNRRIACTVGLLGQRGDSVATKTHQKLVALPSTTVQVGTPFPAKHCADSGDPIRRIGTHARLKCDGYEPCVGDECLNDTSDTLYAYRRRCPV